jgi:hypothetical protein
MMSTGQRCGALEVCLEAVRVREPAALLLLGLLPELVGEVETERRLDRLRNNNNGISACRYRCKGPHPHVLVDPNTHPYLNGISLTHSVLPVQLPSSQSYP